MPERTTTVRFAEEVYGRLEEASRRTGLPINSIVTVACLEWLQHGAGQLSWLSAAKNWSRMPRVGPIEPQTGRLASGGPPYPFEMFTSSAQHAMELAQKAADVNRQPAIGTEHLLLGLFQVERGLAGRALRALGVEEQSLLEALPPPEEGEKPKRILPTSRVRAVLKYAFEVARSHELQHVGTEHLLQGVVADPECVGARTLATLGVEPDPVRSELERQAEIEET